VLHACDGTIDTLPLAAGGYAPIIVGQAPGGDPGRYVLEVRFSPAP
jgi:hypothetical protein